VPVAVGRLRHRRRLLEGMLAVCREQAELASVVDRVDLRPG
jgi:hypothetical protein